MMNENDEFPFIAFFNLSNKNNCAFLSKTKGFFEWYSIKAHNCY